MKEREYITCRELIDFIAGYLDGELPEAARLEFERHLSACPACVAYFESYQRTIKLGKAALASSEEPAPVPEALVRAIRAARARGIDGDAHPGHC